METRAEAALPPPDRLDSWKEIAAYLKRDVRTLQRWEKDEGLPVHRLQHGKQGTVYAHRHEIDRWWESRRRDLERPAVTPLKKRWIAVVSIAFVAAAVAALWPLALRRPARVDPIGGEPPLLQFSIVHPDDGLNSLAVSPDGRELAYNTCCTDWRIWRHSFASATTSAVPATQGGRYPFWSPDGSRLAFFADGKLKVSEVSGGPPLIICDAPGPISGGSWGASGEILFSAGLRLFRVSAAGGVATAVVTSDDAGSDAPRKAPRFLPDGRHFVYHVADFLHPGTYIASIDSADVKRLVDSDYPAVFAAPSHLLYVRGTGLFAQRLNVATGEMEGEAFLLASDVAPGALITTALFGASNNGVLAFVTARGGRRAHLTWFDHLGTSGASLPEIGDAEFLNPAISPNGAYVAVNRMDPQTGNWDIWTVDVARGLTTRVTVNPAQDSDPVWSPDGKAIVFVSTRDGHLALYRKAIDSLQPEQPLLHVDNASFLAPSDWSRDGKFILYSAVLHGSTGNAIWALPLTGEPTPVRLSRPEFGEYGGRISPDGRWLAYSSSESGVNEVFVQPFMSPGPKTQISSGGGAHPRWSADGHELVYWATPRGLDSVTLTFSPTGVRASAARTLISSPIPNLLDSRTHFDLARDGRLLLRQPVGAAAPTITVISNWWEKLKP